jgi:hypothetical protein
MIDAGVSPRKAWCPATAWKRIAPTEKTSAARLGGAPRMRSGAA